MIHTTALLRFVLSAAVLLVGAVAAFTQDDKIQQKPFVEDYVRAVMSAPPASLGVDPFYKKHTDALGIAILSSEKVPDAALLVARDIVIHMLGFWSNYEYMDGNTRVQTPEDLQRYDQKLYALLGRVYEDHHIPMDVYYGKNIRPARSRR